ncbi:MAG: hypothetical protein ACKVVP_14860 [Chloroflexota bacterium]
MSTLGDIEPNPTDLDLEVEYVIELDDIEATSTVRQNQGSETDSQGA